MNSRIVEENLNLVTMHIFAQIETILLAANYIQNFSFPNLNFEDHFGPVTTFKHPL